MVISLELSSRAGLVISKAVSLTKLFCICRLRFFSFFHAARAMAMANIGRHPRTGILYGRLSINPGGL